ncbi:MAG: FAD-binding and (Fe-S)-binding domain-containing protein [Burkholderiales bacterium]|nr:FAD-binding protein [Rhodocyclaceae bacterium]MCA3020553.1 FAD-binding protein [Rhodocyclaceae bacterium]
MSIIQFHARQPHAKNGEFPRLAQELKKHCDGEVLFDAASCGRYATDASIYQITPVGVFVPRSIAAAQVAIEVTAMHGIPILPRGAGTSQCGQTVGAALVIDSAKHCNRLVSVDVDTRRAVVEPGMVLDDLNTQLKPLGLWFPVDVSTSAQATIGGMAGNNSCGSRSIFYGNMVHNVAAIDALLADGTTARFDDAPDIAGNVRFKQIVDGVKRICDREHDEIAARFPPLLRRVAGYNLDIFNPRDPMRYNTALPNLAHLLVGSEGTLAYFKSLELKLSTLPKHKVLGVVNFPTFYQAMELTQHIVTLGPVAVELVDRTMIDLARNNPAFRPVIDAALIGEPDAILLVEFAGDDLAEINKRLDDLDVLMADLGIPKCVVKMTDANAQKQLWEVRKAGLNIMMSMKGDGKPVSFIEDCAVPLPHLAEYTRRLTEVFEKYGTRGTWYAHASVGTLHVRPILNMKTDGAGKMRAIAEEAAVLVKEYKGVYSGEHGDGLVRSEWIAPFFGSRLTSALGEIKALFDPKNLMNPGKIVSPSRQDDRSLFRYKLDYQTTPIATALDWKSDFGDRGLAAAVEMCNNNGHCRKFDAGTMCPSYRATKDEQHVTRGRANTLRLALSQQIEGGFASASVKEAMDLCVGCKGCKRECPTGVDMAKMKVEFLHHYKAKHGHTLRDKLVAYLPRYAPTVSKIAWLANMLEASPILKGLRERLVGLSATRSLPRWSTPTDISSSLGSSAGSKQARKEVVLFADTFNTHFEAENVVAAIKVLDAAGYAVQIVRAADGQHPLCCGRTFLATGMVDEAKREARRTIDALMPYVERDVAIVGLEPSCLLTLRDEFQSMFPGEQTNKLAASASLIEEFLVREKRAGRLNLTLHAIPSKQALLHGHCHQKAFGVMSDVEEVLSWIPELKTHTIESSCCGMAGSFGYEAEHLEVSMKMGELSVLPAVRASQTDTLIVADGTSCRHQIKDGSARDAVHVVQVLASALG